MMNLKITKHGIFYGTFKLGFWEYFAMFLIVLIYVGLIFGDFKLCNH